MIQHASRRLHVQSAVGVRERLRVEAKRRAVFHDKPLRRVRGRIAARGPAVVQDQRVAAAAADGQRAEVVRVRALEHGRAV